MRLTPRTLDQIVSPISAAETLLAELQNDRPVLDLSQGAPAYPTADVVADHIAQVAHNPDGTRYTPRPGLPELRRLLAQELCRVYQGSVTADQILITAGCNQAFCLVTSALASVGDEVLVPIPYYFNHDMWLRLDRITPIYFATDDRFVPSVESARRVLSKRTRAIILVTPGNPTGITIPPEVIEAFADLAAGHDIVLILDETYRSFRPTDGPPHSLFRRPDWSANIVSLHSFSKDFAIPGCRVGAVAGDERLLAEVMKLFSCLAICAPRLGQEAAIAGLLHAIQWRDERVAEMRRVQAAFETEMADHPGGFELCSVGAFYGWIRHPFEKEPTDSVVRRLAVDHSVLVLPGTVFMPTDERYLRLSYANLTLADTVELGSRLREMQK